MSAVAKTANAGNGPAREEVTLLGWLHFLAAYCPLHQRYAAADLAKIFLPAINAGCVRTFANEDGAICAALIDANAEGVGEPHLINRAMLAELEGLRAARATDVAESSAILAALVPLIDKLPAQTTEEGA